MGGEIDILSRPLMDMLSAKTTIFVATGALYSGGRIKISRLNVIGETVSNQTKRASTAT